MPQSDNQRPASIASADTLEQTAVAAVEKKTVARQAGRRRKAGKQAKAVKTNYSSYWLT